MHSLPAAVARRRHEGCVVAGVLGETSPFAATAGASRPRIGCIGSTERQSRSIARSSSDALWRACAAYPARRTISADASQLMDRRHAQDLVMLRPRSPSESSDAGRMCTSASVCASTYCDVRWVPLSCPAFAISQSASRSISPLRPCGNMSWIGVMPRRAPEREEACPRADQFETHGLISEGPLRFNADRAPTVYRLAA